MYTPIQLDKSRNLRYGMKALSLIEKRLGKPIGAVDFNSLTIEETMTVLWAGLVHEDSALTEDQILEAIDDNNVNFFYVVEKMIEAISDAFPEESAEAGGKPSKAASPKSTRKG